MLEKIDEFVEQNLEDFLEEIEPALPEIRTDIRNAIREKYPLSISDEEIDTLIKEVAPKVLKTFLERKMKGEEIAEEAVIGEIVKQVKNPINFPKKVGY